MAQYDEHTNSYAHHHKARLRDVHVNARPTPKDELDKRKEKERRREEKELRKIAAANGVKMVKPPALSPPTQSASSSALPQVSASVSSHDTRMELHTASSELKKGGWAAVSSSTSQLGFKKSSWSTVTPPLPHPQPLVKAWPSTSMGAQPSPPAFPQPHTSSEAPAFRNAGWTSLETSNSQDLVSAQTTMPPDRPIETFPVSLAAQAPPPPESQTASALPLRPIGAGWKQFQSSMKGKNRQ